MVGVRERDGSTRVVGRAREGAVPDGRSLHEIGSITKTFTALLPGTRVPARDGVEITLAHLATHTSGLLEALGRARLRRTPGTGTVHYSNLGVGVLGQALAHATGTSYGDLVQQRVCAPLGLVATATDDRLSDEQRSRLVPGHRRRSAPAAPWPLAGMPGAGALRSTVDDLLVYLEAQLDPASTPLGEAVRLTQQPRVTRGQTIGLGWLRHDRPDHLWWHNGGTGGYRSFVGFVPAERVAVVVLSNHARSVDLLALRRLRLAVEQ
ncbi:serine hydrolase domain-containing protein [Nocardioides marinisabuli]|uniref:serine hydrolase domain-containing protein n=1 Tax=Nocardioides marinisabuli TaxID=419476 RepID=UPI0015DE1E07|nr:serine hydrolase domain-containing protein [Nocardioides marinisabuli]